MAQGEISTPATSNSFPKEKNTLYQRIEMERSCDNANACTLTDSGVNVKARAGILLLEVLYYDRINI